MYHFVRRGSTPLLFYKVKIWLYRFLVWQAHRKSKKIIVPTKTVAKEFTELQPWTRKKLVVTYEAGELPMTEGSERPSEVPAGLKFIMYVGTAFPHKNLPGLIKGFEVLHKTHPNLTLVLTGKIEKHYDELMAWTQRRDIYKHIIFTGFVSNAELKWLFENCQAYVFASLSEGFGLPPLEAMAHKAPVVSSNASCMPEVYGDAAHYFNPRSPKDLGEKVGEVIDSPALKKQLISNGRKQLKKYSWERMAQETLIVYKEALGEETDI
jgi:glycosyltransferase involved in cell wall biosynthesis